MLGFCLPQAPVHALSVLKAIKLLTEVKQAKMRSNSSTSLGNDVQFHGTDVGV